jgi:hypothetical protein
VDLGMAARDQRIIELDVALVTDIAAELDRLGAERESGAAAVDAAEQHHQGVAGFLGGSPSPILGRLPLVLILALAPRAHASPKHTRWFVDPPALPPGAGERRSSGRSAAQVLTADPAMIARAGRTAGGNTAHPRTLVYRVPACGDCRDPG